MTSLSRGSSYLLYERTHGGRERKPAPGQEVVRRGRVPPRVLVNVLWIVTGDALLDVRPIPSLRFVAQSQLQIE